jgi:hypothetical protein
MTFASKAHNPLVPVLAKIDLVFFILSGIKYYIYEISEYLHHSKLSAVW